MSFLKNLNTSKNAQVTRKPAKKATATEMDFERELEDLIDKADPINTDLKALTRRVRKDDDKIEDLELIGIKTDRLLRDMGDVDIASIKESHKKLQGSLQGLRDLLDDEDDPADPADLKQVIRRIKGDIRTLTDMIAEADEILDALEDDIKEAEHKAPLLSLPAADPDDADDSAVADTADSDDTAATSPLTKDSLASIAVSLNRMAFGDKLEQKYQDWVKAGRKFDDLKFDGHTVKPYYEEVRIRGTRRTSKVYEAKTADDLEGAIFGWKEKGELVPAPAGKTLEFIQYVYENELS